MLLKSAFYTVKVQLTPVFSAQYIALGLTGNVKLWQHWRLQVFLTPQIALTSLELGTGDTASLPCKPTPHRSICTTKDRWSQGIGDREGLFFLLHPCFSFASDGYLYCQLIHFPLQHLFASFLLQFMNGRMLKMWKNAVFKWMCASNLSLKPQYWSLRKLGEGENRPGCCSCCLLHPFQCITSWLW